MDAITLLKEDHKRVRELFRRFDKAGDRAHKTRRKIVDDLIRELSVHAEIEEQLFYPAARAADRSMVLESLEEHHIVKWTLNELEDMDPREERFEAKVTVLKENVLHHAQEEERDLFPKVRKAMKPAQLRELGEQMEQLKKVAPTRPHPRSPDTPPGNVLAAPAAAIMDAGKEIVSGVAERVLKRGDRDG